MRAFFDKYYIELRLALIGVYLTIMTAVTYVKTGKINAEFTLLFGLVGCLVGAVRVMLKATRDLRIKNESLTYRVNALEHFVLSTPKSIDPLAKKAEEKLPS